MYSFLKLNINFATRLSIQSPEAIKTFCLYSSPRNVPVIRGRGRLWYKKKGGARGEFSKDHQRVTKILFCGLGLKFFSILRGTSLLRSRSGRSHVTLPVPTRLLQTDIHSFLGVLRFCLLEPMSLSFSWHCIRCTNHRREHWQENENHTLIGLFPRKECMSV